MSPDLLAGLSGTDIAILAVLLPAGLSLLAVMLTTGVPPLPSDRRVVAAMLAMVPGDGRGATIHELGCGWGGLAFALAARFPDSRVVGIELSPLPWLVCRLRLLVRPRRNLRFRYGNFFAMDQGGADLLFCYLMARPMVPLAAKLAAELRPGAIVISHAFPLGDLAPDAVTMAAAPRPALIYRYCF